MKIRSVKPDVYDKEYYLGDCSGYEEFKKDCGLTLNSRFQKSLTKLKITKGMRLLDIGCGRGEAAFWAAKQGVEVIGIDYSNDGVALAKDALKKQPRSVQKLVKFEVRNAKEIDYRKNSFDVILLLDVLEHLYPEEQEIVLTNAYQVLKKGGVILAHTEPNRLFIDIAYRFWCYPMSKLLIGFWNTLRSDNHDSLHPSDKLRTSSHAIMHINEPTYLSLLKVFEKNGFKTTINAENQFLKPKISWKDSLYNFLVFLDPFSRFLPLKIIFTNDFIIVGEKI